MAIPTVTERLRFRGRRPPGGPKGVAAAAALAALLLLALPETPSAHEVPADVTVLALVKAEDGRLRMLVRVPLESMRDIDFPLEDPGYLDVPATRQLLDDAALTWIAPFVELLEEGAALSRPSVAETRLSLPSDRSFERWETAIAHVGGSLPDDTEIPWRQAMLDVLLETPIDSAGSDFAVRSGLAHLGIETRTVLRFVLPDGGVRAFDFTGDAGTVRLDPSWWHATARFLVLGFEHILTGLDHILFLLCLLVPFRSVRGLVPIVTAFTVAHSITLIAAATGLTPDALWFPPLVETLIAASIVWMAFENIVGARLHRRWMLAFGFGLVHGFGFSFLLSESLQFAGGHLLTSLLTFNVGVELGQIAFLLVAVPVADFVLTRVPERTGVIVVSAVLAHTGWHWMTERGGTLGAYDYRLPTMDLALLAEVMRWATLALVVVGALWGLREAFDRLVGGSAPAKGARDAA